MHNYRAAASRLTLKEILREVFQAENKWSHNSNSHTQQWYRQYVIIKHSISAYFYSFLLLPNLKNKGIKEYCINCIVRPLTYRNVIYLPIITQRRWVGAKMYWATEMAPDGNSNPQEQMNRTRNSEKIIITNIL